MELKQNYIRFADAPDDWTPDWHIKPLWQKNGLNFILGAPKSHKTMLRRYLLACAIAGEPAFGQFPCLHPVENALVMLAEDHEGAEKGRMSNVFSELGYTKNPPVTFLPSLGFSFSKPSHVENLLKSIDDEGFDFISIDPFIHFHHAPENDNTEMSKILVVLRQIAREKATMLVVHHTSKPPQQTVGVSDRTVGESGRGASATPGAADTQILVRKVGSSWNHKLSFENKNEEPEIMDAFLSKETWIWREMKPLDPEMIVDYVGNHSGTTVNKTAKALGYRKEDTIAMINKMIEDGVLMAVEGARKSKKLFLTGSQLVPSRG